MSDTTTQAYCRFGQYLTRERWLSIWYQLAEVASLEVASVLEIGPGPGLFKLLAEHYGIDVKTVDNDPHTGPDHVASATALPFKDQAYDCVCAFQVLEHLPYDQSLRAFNEMARVSSRHIVVSLPDARVMWVYALHVPRCGRKIFHLPRPFWRPRRHRFAGQHYWELNKQGFALEKVLRDFTQGPARLVRTYRLPEQPYWRFLVFRKAAHCPCPQNAT